MPAAAVIPAPIAYIKVVAVKKLVVGFRRGVVGLYLVYSLLATSCFFAKTALALHWVGRRIGGVYFEKIRVFKAGVRLNT